MSTVINGIGVSPGIRIGKAHLYMGSNIIIPKYTINKKDIQNELDRFEAALEKTKIEINSIRELRTLIRWMSWPMHFMCRLWWII